MQLYWRSYQQQQMCTRMRLYANAHRCECTYLYYLCIACSDFRFSNCLARISFVRFHWYVCLCGYVCSYVCMCAGIYCCIVQHCSPQKTARLVNRNRFMPTCWPTWRMSAPIAEFSTKLSVKVEVFLAAWQRQLLMPRWVGWAITSHNWSFFVSIQSFHFQNFATYWIDYTYSKVLKEAI